MMPIYFQTELGFSTAKIGIILAAMSITALISMLPSGISNDFITSRRLATIALILLMTSIGLLYITRSFFIVLILMILTGGSRELFRLSLETFVFKSNELSNMPESLGNYHGSRMLGLFGGMVITALILGKTSFREFFLVIGFALLIPLSLSFFLPDSPISKSSSQEYKRELIRPSIIIFMLFSFIFTTHWGAEYVNYGLFLSKNLHLSNSESALYMSVEFLLIGLTLPFFGRNYRKFNFEYTTIIAILLSGIGHILMVNDNIFISVTFRAIHGLGDGLLIIVSYMIIAEKFSKERIGGLNAVINVVMMAGMLSGSILYGYLGNRLGSGISIIISGIITIISTPIIYFWFYLNKKELIKANSKPNNLKS